MAHTNLLRAAALVIVTLTLAGCTTGQGQPAGGQGETSANTHRSPVVVPLPLPTTAPVGLPSLPPEAGGGQVLVPVIGGTSSASLPTFETAKRKPFTVYYNCQGGGDLAFVLNGKEDFKAPCDGTPGNVQAITDGGRQELSVKVSANNAVWQVMVVAR